MINLRGIAVLLITSSILLGLAALVPTAMACGWDFALDVWGADRCVTGGTPALVWSGAVASFAVFMKVFWAALAAFLVWRKVRDK